jgi:hypothetical protein
MDAAVLSSLNNFSVRINRPTTLSAMITAQKLVIHQHTSKVGLSSLNRCNGGGSEYRGMSTSALWACRARHPPKRDERVGVVFPLSEPRILKRLVGWVS